MPGDDQLERSPEAISPRLNQGALAFLQDMLRQALAKVHGLDKLCEEGLLPGVPKGYLATGGL